MTAVAIVAFLLLAIGVATLLINRDVISRRGRRRRHRRQSDLPFLFFPTTGPNAPPLPVPAWRSASDGTREPASLQPEPGIADLPPAPDPEPELVDLSPRDLTRPVLWDRTVPFEPVAEQRLRPDD
jgi:hypothetical protein